MAKILLLEDDTDQAELMAQYLYQVGHEVRIVSDASVAIEALSSDVFDLAITDIFIRQGGVMVGNGGLRLIGNIRNGKRPDTGATPHDIPIIAISGVLGGPTDDHFLKMADSVGANLRMMKPVHPKQLLAAIEKLLAERDTA
ncbi:response regulator [Pseudooceanicola sp. HF7]|uniref:response regulator n=1 Tax=Pseudooceanicola sp. HF7 TaxID=2721560 RepID=UPI001430E821|nr:response regulator [Pseudooceanicola sp. HF7]NIZ08450.1 response regulator [Pseudooceanicola sp. HF7]